MKETAKKSVLVAMSGGVDSSVAACLLSRTMKVVGVTMKLWCYGSQPGSARACCSEESIEDARDVARTLGIKHYVIDVEAEFERDVVRKFLAEYLKGRTPNPCVLCNSSVRFRSLLEKARALGLDAVATGHYVRLSYDDRAMRHQLSRAVDKAKDQSYFLWGLKQDALVKCIFPLGELRKDEVRNLARKEKLPVAEKKESQDICFVENGKYGEFLEKRLRRKARQAEDGPILDENGKRIGTHRGAIRYTIGQRKGLGIAAARPLYVTGIDARTNAVRVGHEEKLYRSSLRATGLNLVSTAFIGEESLASVKIRYRHPPAKARVFREGGGTIRIEFEKPQRAVTPGQSVVLYDDDVLIGGATIAWVVDMGNETALSL